MNTEKRLLAIVSQNVSSSEMRSAIENVIRDDLLHYSSSCKLKFLYSHHPAVGGISGDLKTAAEFRPEFRQAIREFSPQVVYAHLGTASSLLVPLLNEARHEFRILLIDNEVDYDQRPLTLLIANAQVSLAFGSEWLGGGYLTLYEKQEYWA